MDLRHQHPAGYRRDDGAIVFSCVTFVVGVVSFVLWELYGGAQPVVDLRVFRYRNGRIGAATARIARHLSTPLVARSTSRIDTRVLLVLGFAKTARASRSSGCA